MAKIIEITTKVLVERGPDLPMSEPIDSYLP